MKRKGSALLRSRVRSSRVSTTSPKRKRTRGGLASRRHSLVNVEARVDGTGRVVMVGMVANALLCDRGRPRTVLRPDIVERPIAGIPGEGSRGITERESRSKAVRGVGWTHSSDEERADDTRNPCPPKEVLRCVETRGATVRGENPVQRRGPGLEWWKRTDGITRARDKSQKVVAAEANTPTGETGWRMRKTVPKPTPAGQGESTW